MGTKSRHVTIPSHGVTSDSQICHLHIQKAPLHLNSQTLLHHSLTMIPHLYAMDSQHKCSEILTQIHTSSTPSTILSTITSIESFLSQHTVDQNKSFFSIAFPSLICKIFGFDEHKSSWIDQILQSQPSTDTELEVRVFNLLSPTGTLFASINAIDRNRLVKYIFPVERLPEWVRYMVQNNNENDARVLTDLCPLFSTKIKDSVVQLNVFEYYMFWFAYYPVCRGEGTNNVVVKKRGRFRFENWTTFSGLAAPAAATGQKVGCGVYMKLLYAYLNAFVPNIGNEVLHQPYRSSLLHYSGGCDGPVVAQMEFVVNTLIQFWLVDNDFSPVPVTLRKSFGVVFPFRAVLGETPPTSGLGEVLMLFVKYLNSISGSAEGNESVSHSPRGRGLGFGVYVKTGAGSQVGNGGCVSSWNVLVQRPLYRFILRTFLFCPVETYIKNVSQVFSLWMSYIEPWKTNLDEFEDVDAFIGQCTRDSKDSGKSTTEYTSSWESYVLCNYLFYSSLVMHFLGFAHKFLHTDVDTIIQMVLKVLNVLTSSRELRELMKKVDAAFHSRPSRSSSLMVDSAHKFVPSIREQLQDWEDGLCENDADGSFLHENWNQDLRLFSDGEDGGQQLLQLFVLRAESEVHCNSSSDSLSKNLKDLDAIKSQMDILFGGTIESPRTRQMNQCSPSKDDLFKPHKLVDVRYKGDWMRRPISDGEVAWLAKLLVWLSAWLNEILGLNPGSYVDSTPSVSYVDVPKDDIVKVGGLKEFIKVALSSVISCALLLVMWILRFMREHGYRVNLRVFASKKFVMVFVLAAVFSLVKTALRLCC